MINKSDAPSKTKDNELFAVDVVNMTRIHIWYVTFIIFKNTLEGAKLKDERIRDHLKTLCSIFALNELKRDSTACYESGYFQNGASQMINDALKSLINELRPQMIPLVESFYLRDEYMPSAIGNSYGDIYETQFEWARTSSLNKTDVYPGIIENIFPIINAPKL
jgi:acyl-CoA oxidase